MGSITPSIYGLVSTLKLQAWSDPQKLQARQNINAASLGANTFIGLQSFSGTDTPGLQLKSLTTAQITALATASELPNGSICRDSDTDRIDARLARGTVELLDTAGGQQVNGTITATGSIRASSFWSGAGNNTIVNGDGGAVILQTGGFGRWQISANNWIPVTTNALDLGSTTNRVRDLYTGGINATGNLSTVGTITYSSINFPELVTNGGFDTDTAWSKGTGWTISGGTAVATGVVSFADFQQNLPAIELGAHYVVRFTLNVTSGSVAVFIGSSGDALSQVGPNNITQTGTHSYLFHKNSISAVRTLVIRANSAFTGTIDNVSVRRAF